MFHALETPRLLLKPLEVSDAAQVQQIFPRWEIVQHLNSAVPWPFPPDGVETYYREAALPAIERAHEWHWTIRLRSAPEAIIGAIGLTASNTPGNPHNNNRGFWLSPEHQHQGYMTEAVIAVNDYWFHELGFPTLQVSKAVANTGSIRISQKTGMKLVGFRTGDYVSGQLPTEVWSISRGEWLAWRARNDR